MKIGFTGTRDGMTLEQKRVLRSLLELYYAIAPSSKNDFHYGDCIGSDAEAFAIAKELGYITINHPPDNPRLRAFTRADHEYRAKPYLERNKDIVEMCDLLIATPKEHKKANKGGTWWTVRCAYRTPRPVTIIWPDGTTEST